MYPNGKKSHRHKMCIIIKRVFNCHSLSLSIHDKEELTIGLLSYRQYHLVAKLHF